MRHDEDVIALVERQGSGDIVVVPHDRLLRAVGFAGVRELGPAVEQRAGKPHARQGRNGGAAHMPAAEHHGADRQGNGQHKPAVRDAASLLTANQIARHGAVACEQGAIGIEQRDAFARLWQAIAAA